MDIIKYKLGWAIHVHIVPNASKEQIKMIEWEEKKVLKVFVTLQRERGQANKALISLLAKKLRLAKSCFEFIYGEFDTKKLIYVKCDEEKLKQLCEIVC